MLPEMFVSNEFPRCILKQEQILMLNIHASFIDNLIGGTTKLPVFPTLLFEKVIGFNQYDYE